MGADVRGLVIPRSTWLVGEIESKFEMDGFECVFRDRVARMVDAEQHTLRIYNIDRIRAAEALKYALLHIFIRGAGGRTRRERRKKEKKPDSCLASSARPRLARAR